MSGIVLAMGFFDSVHLGHAKIIKKCVSEATRLNAMPAVLTFDDRFLYALGYRDAGVIFTIDERKPLYLELGAEKIIVLSSDGETLSSKVEKFHEYLLTLDLKALVIGKDFTYASKAEGNAETLETFAKANGIDIFIEDFERFDGKKVSSTDIRRKLAEGDIGAVNRLMKREFYLEGEVKHGRGDGNKFNIPTANVTTKPYKMLPMSGVYATSTTIDGETFLSVTNVGTQPTFLSEVSVVETLVLGLDKDIYGKTIRVSFKERLRGIVKFDSIDDLRYQISKDIARVHDKYGKSDGQVRRSR